METPFELGPIQKQWLSDLRKYPERQMRKMLGAEQGDGTLRLCCLGQGLITLCEINNQTPMFRGGHLFDGGDDTCLEESYKKLGLIESTGWLATQATMNGRWFHSLLSMNDNGLTWPEIADYIEANPTNVFTEPK